MEEVFTLQGASCRLGRKTFDHLSAEHLYRQISWRQNDITVFGKTHKEPRLTAWFGPAYTYSKITWPAAEMPPQVQRICDYLVQEFGFPFNAVLLNAYRNGSDAMGWHRDNEPEIDQSMIASISLGATRSFKIRQRNGNRQWTIELDHGALLLMENMQEHFEHCIPRRKKVDQLRINLTFRRVFS